MDFVLHNPLAEMPGPLFLAFYATVIGVTLIACYLFVRQDLHPHSPLPSLPFKPDPYEIAFLRGGENETIRLAVFVLMQRGLLQIEEGKTNRLYAGAASGGGQELSLIERETLAHFHTPQAASEIFNSTLPSRIKRLCRPYEERLTAAGLLYSAETAERSHQAFMVATLVIFGLGGYKFTAALMNGHHNVGFLLLMALLSLTALAAVCKPPRLSWLGEQYLARMQQAYARLNTRNPKSFDAAESVYSEQTENTLLALAVFGVGVMAATPYAAYHRMFQRAAGTQYRSGGCGAGCGSVSACSSGGGRCSGGGCGGGGCGGCGGG